MIDLAPNHKLGLLVANPILLAGGSIGYGEALHPALTTAQLGAVVVGPLLMHSHAGAAPPRLSELADGFVLNTGLQNRGLDAVLRNFARLWPRLGCPVIVQIAESDRRHLSRMVQRLEEIEAVSGIELLLAQDVEKRSVKGLVRAIVGSCDLPLWVKVPLDRASELAPLCVENEAVAIVAGSAQAGLVSELPLTGNAFGPVISPYTLKVVQAIAALRLDCALIACGGMQTAAQVQQVLAAGASAVQIDSAVWSEPGLPAYLIQRLMGANPGTLVTAKP